MTAPPHGWVEQIVALDGLEIAIHLPPDPFAEELIDMEMYEREEELPYWAELWPSALALARVLRRRRLQGLRVLELGCGMALPSIVAAAGGAHVTATDFQPDALDAARHNAAINGVAITFAVADWRDHASLVAQGPWDLVIGADLLYEFHQIDTLHGVLVALGAPVLLGDQDRRPSAAFFERVRIDFDVQSTQDPELPHVAVHALTPIG